MAKQLLVWTILPNGPGESNGSWRVSLVLSPRLTPQKASEQQLNAFPTFKDWPALLAKLKFSLKTAQGLVPLKVIKKPKPDSALWGRLFFEQSQGIKVSGFEFCDFSEKNLFSFSTRDVTRFIREHYSKVAVDSPQKHPTLLPFRSSQNALGEMLRQLGTNEKGARLFKRFFDGPLNGSDQVFGPNARKHEAPNANGKGSVVFPLRVMPLPEAWTSNAPQGSWLANFASAEEYAFYQANRFYKRSALTPDQLKQRRPDFKNVVASPKEPEFDFHRLLASLADYPALQRALGLIIDCEIPADSVVAQQISAGGSGQFSLVVDWGKWGSAADDRCPTSVWQAQDGRFTMQPRSALIRSGMLNVSNATEAGSGQPGNPHFDVYTLDVDGSALKTVNFLLTAQNLVSRTAGSEKKVTYTTGNEQPLATLRSSGIGINAYGRARQVATDAATAKDKNSKIAASAQDANSVLLFAEDVHRGYRVDVESGGVWRSLHDRIGDYQVAGLDYAQVQDEGYSKGPSTSAEPDNPEDQYLHESVFRWTGWSLSAQRPGRTIVAEEAKDGHLQQETVTEVTAAARSGNRIVARFRAAPKSLPKLRFGASYRLRARIVDLAGNSLALNTPKLSAAQEVTAPVTYRRLEAIDPPVLVPRARFSEGESLERMVIRSHYDADSSSYLETPQFKAATATPASADFEYAPLCVRHFVPPKTSQTLAETHGAFDVAFSGAASPADIKKMYAFAQREEGTLFDQTANAQIELVTPSQVQATATSTSLPLAKPGPDAPTGDRVTGGQYVVRREAVLETPYLPDVPAAGVALWGVPGLKQTTVLKGGLQVKIAPDEQLVLLVPYAGQWPFVNGFRLEVKERLETPPGAGCAVGFKDSGEPTWDENGKERVLTIYLAKGDMARMRYASYPDEKRLNEFAIPDWVGSKQSKVQTWAKLGGHWMLSPFRALVAVHATQAPVCAPTASLTAQRTVGASQATLQGKVTLHYVSTGQFDLSAQWQEWIDEPGSEGPVRRQASAQLAPVKLPEVNKNAQNIQSLQQLVDVSVDTGDAAQARGDVHDFGDQKFRLVQYQPRALTRFHEYLPPPIHDDIQQVSRLGEVSNPVGMTEPVMPGDPVLVSSGSRFAGVVVPASARPAAPVVSHCVPSFKWSRGITGAQRWSVRLGNAIRVFLERPWFSSGDGELLGVLIHPSAAFENIKDEKVVRYTEWGCDPIWQASPTSTMAKLTDFPASIHSKPLVKLPDGGQAQVAGHRVMWDAQRKKWSCDIELQVGNGYTPFVRLALARYQPNAIADCEVSAQVIAEFAQLMPARGASLTLDNTVLRWQVYGESMRLGPLDSYYSELDLNRMELVLQQHAPDKPGELGWQDVSVIAQSQVNPDAQAVDAPPQPWMVGGILWQGSANLNLPAGNWRLMLREFERYPTDEVSPRTAIQRERMVIGERLVYVETFSFI